MSILDLTSGDVLSLLSNYGAVIVTDNSLPLATLTAWDEYCRTHNIVFTLAITSGVLGFVFSDFGDHHICSDFDGEPHKYIAIQNIEMNADNKFELQLDDNHDLDDDQTQFQVEDVEGIPEFKDKTFVLKRFYTSGRRLVPDRVIIDSIAPSDDGVAAPAVDFSSWGTYQRSGYIRETASTSTFSLSS